MTTDEQRGVQVAFADALLLNAMVPDGDAQIVRAAADCTAAGIGGQAVVELASCIPKQLGRFEFDRLMEDARTDVGFAPLEGDDQQVRTAQALARAWDAGLITTDDVFRWISRFDEEQPWDLYDLWHLWSSEATFGLDRRDKDAMLAPILAEIAGLPDPWVGAATN